GHDVAVGWVDCHPPHGAVVALLQDRETGSIRAKGRVRHPARRQVADQHFDVASPVGLAPAEYDRPARLHYQRIEKWAGPAGQAGLRERPSVSESRIEGTARGI